MDALPQHRAQAQTETTRVPEGLDQAASSSNRRLGSWQGSIRPGADRNPPEPGSAENSLRAIASPPGKSPASHRMMIINRSIIVSTPHIGWFLLPNTPLVKKTRCLLFVGFGRLFGPPKTLYVFTPSNLNRVVGNCNQEFRGLSRDKPMIGRGLWRSCRETGWIGAFFAVDTGSPAKLLRQSGYV